MAGYHKGLKQQKPHSTSLEIVPFYTVSGKNGTNNVLGITLPKFNKFP